MKMAEHQRVSFAMTHKSSKKGLSGGISSGDNSDHVHKDVEFIDSLEDQQIKSTVPKTEEKTDYVIPLIKNNNWRLPTRKPDGSARSDGQDEELRQQAADAILKDLQMSKEKGEAEEDYLVPLLMRNKPPTIEGQEDNELADVDLRPESSTLEEYEDLPIAKFGEAMLKGMGWKKGEAIGKTNKGLVEPIELMPRAQGRGLGAEEKLVKISGSKRKPGDEPPKPRGGFKDKDGRVRYYKGLDEEIPEQKPEGFAEGNFASVLSGPHKGLYGKILHVNELESRITLKLGINQQTLSFSQENLQLVSAEDYARNKRRPANETPRTQERSDSPSTKAKTDQSVPKSTPDSTLPATRQVGHKGKAASKSSEPAPAPWLFPNLRVRIIDQKFQGGVYYNQKVVILDVITPEVCVCRTDGGQLLEDIHCSMLETVIPKEANSLVMVVNGKHRGKIATMLEKSPSESKALLDLGSGNIKRFHYDYICACSLSNS